MWIADNWKDYEVIDCSKGEKLERWGDYILVRPDPQVIWDTPRKARGWKHMNGHYHRSKKGGGRVGILQPSEAVADPLRLPHLQPKAVQLQAHRALPGTGHELGLVLREDPTHRTFGQGTEPVRLHRRRHPCGSGCRSAGHPRGRLQGNGQLGKRKCRLLRTQGRADPMACGRLCEVRGA